MLRKFLVTFLDGLEKLHRAQGAIFLITGPYLYGAVVIGQATSDAMGLMHLGLQSLSLMPAPALTSRQN